MTCGCASFGADMTWHDAVLDLMAGGIDQLTATRAVVCPEAFPAAVAALPTDWRGFVRSRLHARLPWLRESGAVSDAAVAWAVCAFGVVFVLAVAVVGR